VNSSLRIAFLTGITGQDGSYLCEFLLGKGYVVHGLIRRSSSFNTGRIEHLYEDRHNARPRLFLEYGDLSDSSNLTELLGRIKPDEVYNLAAQSHVKVSFSSFLSMKECETMHVQPPLTFSQIFPGFPFPSSGFI